jgi:hypothetical protein
MPKIELPPRGEAYDKNTKEQYEMLGRFVEAFEAMVNVVRDLCLQLAARDGRNAILVQTILYHESLSAKPLFDILRAIIIETLKDSLRAQHESPCQPDDPERPLLGDDGKSLPLTTEEYETFTGVLGFIHGKYQDLANMRNDLLHGTWFVGYTSQDDPNSSEFYINRLKISGQGLSRPEGLPKTADELKYLAKRCDDVRDWIGHIEHCLQGWQKITQTFELVGTKRTGKRWWLIIYIDDKTTLH